MPGPVWPTAPSSAALIHPGSYSHVAEVRVLSEGSSLDHLQVAVHDGSERKTTNRVRKSEGTSCFHNGFSSAHDHLRCLGLAIVRVSFGIRLGFVLA